MKALSYALILAAFGAGTVHAACSYPTAPEKIPDGSTATMEEMMAAQKAIKTYNDQIKAYTDCLKLEHDQTVAKEGDALTPERKAEMEKMQVQKNNAAVDEAEAITARFNEQVKAFKSRKDTADKS